MTSRIEARIVGSMLDESNEPRPLDERGKDRAEPWWPGLDSLIAQGRIAAGPANGRFGAPSARSRGAGSGEAARLPAGELALRMRKVSGDLLVAAAVLTASLAELAFDAISLVGLLFLIFPGQFGHTSLMALIRRASGASDYGEAFNQQWKAYRAIPNARWALGAYRIRFSFIVGLGLLSPVLGVKGLEWVSGLMRLWGW